MRNVGHRTGTLPAAAMLTLLVLVPGCRQQAPPPGCARQGMPPARTGDAPAGRMRGLAEQAVRASGGEPAAMRFRGVQVYDQAMTGRWAVCGQVAPFADDAGIFVPFVQVLSDDGGGPAPRPVEQHVGTSTAEADRVYMALVTYCYAKGGPAPGRPRGVPPLPPLPDTVPDPHQDRPAAPGPARSAAPAPAPVAAPGSIPVPVPGSVTLRQNATVHAAPHGGPVGIAHGGTTLRVFATAPGGWLQVGDAAPLGWVHESMVERR